MVNQKASVGSTLESLLRGDGTYEEVENEAIKAAVHCHEMPRN